VVPTERKEATYGPFEVLERLGVGVMGTVDRGMERGTNGFERVVALKRLLPHLAEDVEFVRAFVREAKLASQLHHGNIAQLYELGRVGTSYFISMEYVRGRDLRAILRQARRVAGPPPVEVTIAVLTQLLDALDYAHGQCDADGKPLGLIHRDISPSNLIISQTGHLKVVDFGIGKATVGHLMANSGRIKGKLAYMAPEALAGRPLDGRSDLFSASIIAYELLTAAPLFAAKDDFQIIDRLQNMQPPPPSTRNPSCPGELDRIVLRGLAKDPDKRWRSAADMRAAIAQFAVNQRLLATNREVSSWVEDAFQRKAPAATSATTLRLPLAPPPADQRPNGAGSEADDEIMDIVWGLSTSRPLPAFLDEVPDVTSKFPPGPDPSQGEADPTTAVHRSDASLVLVSAASPSPNRNGDVRMAQGQGQGSVATSSQRAAPSPRQVSSQPSRTSGTVPTVQQPQAALEEAMWAAQRAEAMAMAAMATQRRRSPLVPLILASMAVTAAGAGVAWLFSSRRQEPSAISSGQGAQIPPAAQQAATAPSSAAAETRPMTPPPPPPAPAPVAAAAPQQPSTPASSPAASKIVERPSPANDGEARAKNRDEDREDDRRTRRARPQRDSGARGREERERKRGDDERESVASSDERDAAEPDETVTGAEPRPLPSVGMPAGQTPVARTTAPADERDVEPQPVPVEPPAPEPEPSRSASPTSARPSSPIIVSPGRAQRASGNERPIRFPHGEQLPPRITAKLCVDTRGTVTSVTVLSSVSAKVRHTVERALSQWRYQPIVEGGDEVAACFATAFPVHLD
jgi:eukaryotic-like serine/threonine-protein kinase